MERALVSREELVKLVNERIWELSNGACTLGGVLWPPNPDRDGCNWIEGAYGGIYTEAFRRAPGEIRSKYNLLVAEASARAPSPIETRSHPWVRVGARALGTSRRSR